jgi:2-polyprenyl-3-methyl-5-hydroxy-6-metoxy-1,4-benzoquinol methylase
MRTTSSNWIIGVEMTLNITKHELLRFWQSVMDPKNTGLANAIAADLASYTRESVDDVRSKMATGENDLKILWEQIKPDISNSESVASFYRDQFIEAYELAHWHAGGLGEPPLTYAYAAKFAADKGLTRVLDYGSGIGGGVLCFAAVDCKVDAADIAQNLLKFVEHRSRTRGVTVHCIDLNEEKPKLNGYDIITCFDVFEHVPDQYAMLQELLSYLQPGGYLLANFFEDSSHADRPMHISSARDKLTMIRRTSLIPQWINPPVDIDVLLKRPYGKMWNILASWKDWLQRT